MLRNRILVAALVAAGTLAAPPTFAEPQTPSVQQLLQRLEQLEKEVQELRKEKAAEAESLSTERISEAEPEITTRLKAVEQDVQAMKKPSSLAEKLDGVAVEAALTTVWQHANGLPHGADGPKDKLNYRADLTVEVPLEEVGVVEQKLFGHVRIGQGQGLNDPLGMLGHFNVPNAAAFSASGANPNDSVAILGQAWYQAGIPFGENKKHRVEVTLGKMDIFGFFDQNEAAGDEATQFLNGVFVHNPLLDVGGEVGADENGFQPGAIVSYLNESDGAEPWRLSLGVFGSGDEGSNYQKTGDTPLLIAQAEKTFKFFGGRAGNYRLYAWSRRDVPRFYNDAYSSRHTGVGLSFDQQFGDGIKLFGRYGHLVKGKLPFDRAATLGVEINGGYWNRASDALGVAGAWLRASSAYKRNGGEGYLSADSYEAGTPDFTFRPSGAEKVAEIYYRIHLTPNFSLSPDVQWIKRGGANPDADNVTIVGVRANVSY
ncbi:MAG: carbohydrate porin [Azoarcus sp.]|jgi:hypothetical protein|nr:carbohydrate porin [Azoarcus sp.]